MQPFWVLGLVILASSGWWLPCSAQQQAFLEQQMPLKVVVTTPSELALSESAGSAVLLTGRQAITVRLHHRQAHQHACRSDSLSFPSTLAMCQHTGTLA